MSNRATPARRRRHVEDLLKLSSALAAEVSELITRMTAQAEQNRRRNGPGQRPLGQHQLRRQFRLNFPYAVKLQFPTDGLGDRLPQLREAAQRLSTAPHGEWLEQVSGQYYMALGFRSVDEMDSLRAWLLHRGWNELLSSLPPR